VRPPLDGVVLLTGASAGIGADMARHRLATSFPRAVLEDWAAPLHTAGVGNKQVLSAEPL
jgi:hypothetical protein